MARSSLLTAEVRRNLLRWAKEMDDAMGTTSGHHHDGTNSRTLAATGNTLDGAYDQGGAGAGRSITVNDGAVALTKNDAGTENVLEIDASPSAGAAGAGIKVTCGSNSTGAGIEFANTGSGNDIEGTSSLWTVSKAGVGTFDSLSVGQVTLTEDTLPAGTSCYIGRDNTGDVTVNALTGKEVLLAVAGTDVVTIAGAAITLAQAVTVSTGGITVDAGGVTVTGNSTITGDLTVTGDLTFGGNWTVAATLTVDELILDTDGSAPANTNCYAVRDNAGDLTVNAISGKVFHIAIAGTDEYDFSASALDMLANAIDNCGFLILNAATAPANTEVYLVNDNTGDLTANALSGKTVNLAVAGTDVVTVAGASVTFAQSATLDAGATFGTQSISGTTGNFTLSGAGYLAIGANPATAGYIRLSNNVWIAARNAANGADINMIQVDGSDLVAFGANLAATTMGATLTIAAQQISGTTGNLTFSGAGHVSIGANPASAGYIRLSNNVNIAFRNAANGGDINAITVNAADDVEIGADLMLNDNVLYGSDAAHTADTADGLLELRSTVHATKGWVVIPNAELGLIIGSDGAVDRATTVGDNALHIFNGAAAPAGTLTNGISLYSEGGECKVLDAGGNSTTLSPHTPDGDYIIHSYSVKKDETVTIHLEKLVKALIAARIDLAPFMQVTRGNLRKAEALI